MTNDRWHEDVVRRPLLEMTAGLPAEVIAQARARGRSLDLKTVAAELLAELGAAVRWNSVSDPSKKGRS